MAIYVYRRNVSEGATALADALGGRRWRDKQSPLSGRVRPNDVVVSWGEAFASAGVRVLNGGTIRSKLTDAEMLTTAGVPTVEVSRTRPAPRTVAAATDPVEALWERLSEVAEDFINDEPEDIGSYRAAPRVRGISELQAATTSLLDALNRPAPVATTIAAEGEWLGRSASHVGGADLLANNGTDYFTKKEAFTNEFRVHSFLGRSLRAGKKVHRTPTDTTPFRGTPHAWIRSWDGGWKISYDGVSATQAMRDLAASAITALDLQFGAVDIGQRADGTLVVLEVNRAPGIEQGSITVYADAIRRWMTGEWTSDNQQATRRPRNRAA